MTYGHVHVIRWTSPLRVLRTLCLFGLQFAPQFSYTPKYSESNIIVINDNDNQNKTEQNLEHSLKDQLCLKFVIN